MPIIDKKKVVNHLKKLNGKWEKWFAWKSVTTIDGKIVWLSLIERSLDLGFDDLFIDHNINLILHGNKRFCDFYKYRLRSKSCHT